MIGLLQISQLLGVATNNCVKSNARYLDMATGIMIHFSNLWIGNNQVKLVVGRATNNGGEGITK